jgi:putative addiction module component (TIGR02574 family)
MSIPEESTRPQMRRELLSELMELSPSEKIELVDFLWDSLEQEKVRPVTSEELDEMERELTEHRADPSSALSWEDVRTWLWSRRR